GRAHPGRGFRGGGAPRRRNLAARRGVRAARTLHGDVGHAPRRFVGACLVAAFARHRGRGPLGRRKLHVVRSVVLAARIFVGAVARHRSHVGAPPVRSIRAQSWHPRRPTRVLRRQRRGRRLPRAPQVCRALVESFGTTSEVSMFMNLLTLADGMEGETASSRPRLEFSASTSLTRKWTDVSRTTRTLPERKGKRCRKTLTPHSETW